MDYDFSVTYRPGKDNISDYTSRPPMQSEEDIEANVEDEVQQYVNFIIKNDIPAAITRLDIVKSTVEGSILQKVVKCIKYGKIDCKDVDLKPYKDIFAELTNIDGMILRGKRIVVPALLRDKIVEIAHEGIKG